MLQNSIYVKNGYIKEVLQKGNTGQDLEVALYTDFYHSIMHTDVNFVLPDLKAIKQVLLIPCPKII